MKSRLFFFSHLSMFAIVGIVGFLVDAGLLTFLVKKCFYNVYRARLISFSLATLITWYLNSRFVFKINHHGSFMVRYGKYMAVQIGGSLTNLLIFTCVIETYQFLESYPIIPLSIGAIFGFVFNFTGARFWVFRSK